MTKSILVVEDNDDLQILFQLLLESEGYEVTIANNGSEAVEMVEQKSPQLVLMDIMMPGSNGLDVARNIKQRANYQNLPIVLVSAIDRLEERQLHYSKANDIIYKPFNLDDLVDKVSRLAGDNSQFLQAI